MPTVARQWRRFRRVRAVRYVVDKLDIFLKHGVFSPTRILLPPHGNPLYVNASDPRGRQICRDVERRAIHQRAWHHAIGLLTPSIVLDVGLNYGEFLFSGKYSPNARLIGIEANQSLSQWISCSRDEHPNRDQIETHFALASDRNASNIAFFVSKMSSGLSSALPREGDRTEIPSITIDSLFAHDEPIGSSVLFKIDVEGYEPLVLSGMSRVLAKCDTCIGIIEFRGNLLRQLGVDLDSYLKDLTTKFCVSFLDPKRGLTALPDMRYVELIKQLGVKEFKTDLLVASSPNVLEKMQASLLSNVHCNL